MFHFIRRIIRERLTSLRVIVPS